MIQAFQKFSQSRIAKVFLAIVALSFMAFFGGSDWFRPRDPNAIVAQVGELVIGRYEFADKVQKQAQHIMAQSGESVSREDLLKSGLPYVILNQMISEILLNLDATSLGLTVSDTAIRDRIHSMKAFQNEQGVFDRTLFTQLLRSNGMSEDTFIAEVRQDLIHEQIVGAVEVGAGVPEEMIGRLFEAQYQHRQASLLMVSAKSMSTPPKPSAADLEAFYKKNAKLFKTPELRTFSVLVLNPSVFTKGIPVSDEEIQDTYEAKKETFGNKPLEKVKPLVIHEVQKEKALEKLYALSQELEDKIAGGATFEELLKVTPGMELVTISAVDKNGADVMGNPFALLLKDATLTKDVLETAFTLEEGTDSPFTQSKNESYYAVKLDKVSPAAVQPFAEIQDRVLKIWNENKQFEAAKAKAIDYVKSFNRGDRKASLMTLLPNLSLSEESPNVSNEVKALVFTLRPGKAGWVPTAEGYAVVVLNKVIPPSEKVKDEKMDEFRDSLAEQYKNDVVTGYINALRLLYPVIINRDAVKALFS